MAAPTNVAAFVTPENLTVTWKQTSQNCPRLCYNILSTNCGVCPIETEATEATCSLFAIPESETICTLRIQTAICKGTYASISGSSTSISLLLKGIHV